MALKAWSEFLSDARLHLPDCPEPVIEHHLRKAAIELCARSKRLRVGLPAFSTEAETAAYVLDPGEGLGIVEIITASVDGDPIDPAIESEIASISGWQDETGTPDQYFMIDDATVRLWKTPDAAYSVKIAVAVKPSLDATGVETWFADRYRNSIVSGALALLMAIPEKRWSNPTLALYHGGLFEAGVTAATAEAIKSGTSAPLRTVRYSRA